jgi:cellulose synthase operon protein C
MLKTAQTPLAIALISATLLLAGCKGAESPETLIASAKTAMESKDLKAAEIHLKNLLQKTPTSGEGRYLLGKLYYDAGDFRAAEKEFRRSLELSYDRNKVAPSMLESMFQLGEHQKVIDESVNMAADDPLAKAQILNTVGRSMVAQGKRTEAKTKFEAALAAKPDFVSASASLIQMTAAAGDRVAANAAVDELLQKFPTSFEAAALKGDLLLSEGKLSEAKTLFEKVVIGNPRDPMSRAKLGAILIDLQDYPAAKAELTELSKLSPTSPGTLHLKALYEFRQNNLALSQEFVQAALKVAPDYLPAVSLAGNIYLANNSLEQAERAGRTLVERQPNSLQGYRLLAATYLKMNQPERAMQTITPLLNKGVEDSTLLAIAGEAALKSNDPAKAAQYFERSIKLDPKDAGKRTGLALSNLATGKRDAGFVELETAVTLDSQSYQADFALIMARMRDKEFDKALAAVTNFEKKQPKSPVPQNLRAMIYTAKGDFAAARTGFEEALKMDPTFLPAAANLASLDLRDNKPDDAKKRYESILKVDPKNHQAMIALAKHVARFGGTNDQVLEILQQARTKNPGLVPPIVALSTFMIENNKAKDAIPILQESISQNPDKSELLDLLGIAFLKTNDRGQALETYEKMLKIDPKSASLHYRMGELRVAMRDDVAALSNFRKASELQPQAVEPMIALASVLLRLNKRDEALQIAKNLQKDLPNSPAGLVLNGDLLAQEKNWTDAATAYRKAIAIQNTPQTNVKLHTVLVRAGKQTEADQLADQLVKSAPEEVGVRMFAGEQHIANKRWDQAVESYKLVLKKEPNNGIALNNMAWAMFQLKDPKALAVAEQAYAALPQAPSVMDTFGYLNTESGNTKRGLELLKQAIAIAPKSAEIRVHLAQAYAKSGDKESARKELETVLKDSPTGPAADLAKDTLGKL